MVILLTTPSNQMLSAAQKKCTIGWYITGYFTPIEGDYNGSKQLIKVITPASVVQSRAFYTSFLHEVQIEGWGRTLEGDYVGLVTNDKQWHSATKPTGSTGEPLLQHSVAVDPNIIKMGQQLIIPTLPKPWNMITLTASDVGPDIKGKHIDVYTGEGKHAGQETRRITGYDNQLCLI
ncbi:MAG TPA: 3D domain-containing protein [Methylomirabilota bacterium]|nr:3D domain-containing protein [Methylomirabilota bacterium]